MKAEEEIRKVFKLGGSLVLALPKTYVETHDMEAGDQVRIFYNDFIHARPIEKEILLQRLKKAEMILDEESNDIDCTHILDIDYEKTDAKVLTKNSEINSKEVRSDE